MPNELAEIVITIWKFENIFAAVLIFMQQYNMCEILMDIPLLWTMTDNKVAYMIP